MQTPGNQFVGLCTHCHNKDRLVVVINVTWPDHKLTVERLCVEPNKAHDDTPIEPCFEKWGALLVQQGCTLDPSPGVKAFAVAERPRGDRHSHGIPLAGTTPADAPKPPLLQRKM